MNKVVVIGSGVMDTIVRSSLLKTVRSNQIESGVAMCEVMNGKLEAEDGVLVSGGGATNVGVGLRRLGESVKIISRVGKDVPGKMLEEEITREGVDVSMMQKGDGKTGVSVVLVNSEGARSIVAYRGESGKIEGEKIDWEMITKADWLQISSLGGDMELLADVIDFAHTRGVRVGINPGGKEIEKAEKLKELLKKVDMVNLNKMEFKKFLKIDGEDMDTLLKRIADLHIRLAIMTDGKNGAGLLRNNRWIWMETFPNKSIDDTGAGDAFVSGVVKGILDNKNDEEILKMGLANGSSVVTKIGAKAGLLRVDEMEKWMRKKLKFTEEMVR